MRNRGSRIWQRYAQLSSDELLELANEFQRGMHIEDRLQTPLYRTMILREYGDWIRGKADQGYDPYLINFMFRPLVRRTRGNSGTNAA